MEIDGAKSVSPASSLLVHYASQEATTASTLAKAFANGVVPSSVELAFQFMPEALGASGTAVIASLEIFDPKNSQSRYNLQLTLESNGKLRLDEEGVASDGGEIFLPHEPPGGLTLGDWADVKLTAKWSNGQPASATVSFGGTVAIDTTLSPGLDAQSSSVLLTLGGLYVAPSTAWQARFDNVVLTIGQ